ncbi:response regulator transcription factor [Planctomycetes bacterium K23_9]|uniref:Sensory transduction protein regX3 n=1 Tax=Stieleria marina TaxID=1930275 RepID=A0A517NXM2_9BACT|nr:Sensory transduction protein regX3 [Planctomycetes bacterium K23_9]
MRPHILVVEDEQHLGVGIKYNLEAESFRVTLVEDGPTVLKLVDATPDAYDLIVLDLMLPGMSGYTVCETIRDAGMTIPVLMLSARTLAEDRTRGFDAGANQYMSKPFELDELISRVKNLLQTSSRNEQPVLPRRETLEVSETEFGDVKVNFETHEVIVGINHVRMSTKELKLLKYFVENPDRVINRSELLDKVWEVSGNLQTRAVDQFIAKLRKYIEPDPRSPIHLLTIRDAGYRFILHPQTPVENTADSEDENNDSEAAEDADVADSEADD